MTLRTISIALALCLFVCSAANAQLRSASSGWTLSDSATDPFSNIGAATNDTLTIYIWLWCVLPELEGLSSASFFLVDGVQEISDVEFSSGIVDNDPNPYVFDLSLSGCPTGTTLIGQFQCFSYNADFTICPVASTEGTGCEIQDAQTLAWIGYAAGTGFPCLLGPDFFTEIVGCEPPTSVQSASWGAVKALYFDH